MALDLSAVSFPVRDAKQVTPSATAFVGIGKGMQGMFCSAAEEIVVVFPSASITITPTAGQYLPFAARGVTRASGSGTIHAMF
jgi:hypothetical protein